MNTDQNTFTDPEIVTDPTNLNHRSYVTFYFKGERVREYHGKSILKDISPNRAKSLVEKQSQLRSLQFELHKALADNRYPTEIPSSLIQQGPRTFSVIPVECAARLLFRSVVRKLRSNLSRTYKRDLKSVYRQLRDFLDERELEGPISNIKTHRIESFLSQFGSTGTYYMNKRRTLGVLFSVAGRHIDQPLKAVKETPRRKVKARLHEKYSKEQLSSILSFLKEHYRNLYLCCLLTYGTWLRPHEEIRLLTVGDFKVDFTEIHLSGDENKGGRVRVVYVPEYVKSELMPMLSGLSREMNIFTLQIEPFNYSYFNTQWSRAYSKMRLLDLVYENQTIYSFRHTAAVLLYKRTKDVYLLQKLLGHSNIVVTLKYLRTLGELNSEEMRNAAPTL